MTRSDETPETKTNVVDARREAQERRDRGEVDETLDESFPASDPPSWTLGERPDEAQEREEGS